MKKRLNVLLFLIIFFLGGCDFFTTVPLTTLFPSATTETSLTDITASTTKAPVTINIPTRSTTTQTTSPITTVPTVVTTTPTTVPTTTTTTQDTNNSFVLSDYENIQDKLDIVGLPCLGQVKTLVFAVDFSDATQSQSDTTLADIELAFNGTSEALDYESVKSYYKKSSMNQLELDADVFGFYRAEHTASWYEAEFEKIYATDAFGNFIYDEEDLIYPESILIDELLEYYDDEINYDDYDANNDGYIDSIYIVYTTPVSFDSGSDIWWAYQDYYAYEGGAHDNVMPNNFVWAGTDFLWESGSSIDARTWIHETGHLLGLEDYYDYDDTDSKNSGGLGEADMMDSTFGDHNPFSKLMLGWIDPVVVTGTTEIDLESYATSGDVLLIIDQWNDTIFDEYLLVCFYKSDGLYAGSDNQIFSTTGVLIYHVDARIDNGYQSDLAYYSIYNYNNTDTDHKLIKIIEADEDGDIDRYSRSENSDLFQTGDIFRSNTNEAYRWYITSRNPIDFTVEVGTLTVNSVHLKVQFVS